MKFSSSFLWMLIFLLACGNEAEQLASMVHPSEQNINPIPVDSIILNPNEGLVYFQGQVFSGTSIAYYPNGNKAATTEYWKGKKQGYAVKWFENGLKSFECQYLTGRKDGLARTWWKNGNLRSESTFKNGTPHGIQKQWYISGAKFKKMNLNYGKEEGLQQSWRENGKLYNNYEAKNGRIFGLKRANLCYELDNENIQYSSK